MARSITINLSLTELADSVIFLFEVLVFNYRLPKEVATNDNVSPSHQQRPAVVEMSPALIHIISRFLA